MTLSKFQIGKVVNKKNQVLSKLGRGGMGAVVKVKRLNGGEAALKYCHLTDDKSRRRFIREVRVMQKIEHENVVPIMATALKHDPPYFVMPLAEGSLRSRVGECAANHDLALDFFVQLCEGVQAIHGADAVHRDIKPDNALILNGRVVVSDLGLAKFNDRDTTILTQTNAVVGTMMYAAPEQSLPAGSRNADIRTDVFQLGKTLYELLTGDHPVLLDISKVPTGLSHIVRKATQQHPNDRYQTVAQLIDAIRAFQRSRDPNADPVRAYEAIATRVREDAANDRYDEDDIRRVLELLNDGRVRADSDQFLAMFDQLPNTVLRLMAEKEVDAFEAVLQNYIESLDAVVSGRSFSYAETVAEKMSRVIHGVGVKPDLKARALEAILISAVKLNRFAAIESFNNLLKSIAQDEDAIAVREMLDRRRDKYKTVCRGVPSLKLHPAIRTLRDELSPDR